MSSYEDERRMRAHVHWQKCEKRLQKYKGDKKNTRAVYESQAKTAFEDYYRLLGPDTLLPYDREIAHENLLTGAADVSCSNNPDPTNPVRLRIHEVAVEHNPWRGFVIVWTKHRQWRTLFSCILPRDSEAGRTLVKGSRERLTYSRIYVMIIRVC